CPAIRERHGQTTTRTRLRRPPRRCSRRGSPASPSLPTPPPTPRRTDPMNDTARITPYQMNPAEDYLAFGDELEDGMLVLREDISARNRAWPSEDEFLRGQRFCRVPRLRCTGDHIAFIGVYVDGQQKSF